jgi:hypothetical protein
MNTGACEVLNYLVIMTLAVTCIQNEHRCLQDEVDEMLYLHVQWKVLL